MPRKTLDLGNAKPVPDIVSYGRQGPTRRDRLSLEQLHIRRTIERTPEVTIKVLSKGTPAYRVPQSLFREAPQAPRHRVDDLAAAAPPSRFLSAFAATDGRREAHSEAYF